jgi:hypothetical protein
VTVIVAPFGSWDPARPPEAAAIFSKMPCPWWIAGGYAIELAIGWPLRDHDDIDVMVLRQDQFYVGPARLGMVGRGPAGHRAPVASPGAPAGRNPRHLVPAWAW